MSYVLNIEGVINELLLIDDDVLLLVYLRAWLKLFIAISPRLVALHLYTVQHVLAHVVIFNSVESNIIVVVVVALDSFGAS